MTIEIIRCPTCKHLSTWHDHTCKGCCVDMCDCQRSRADILSEVR